MGLGDVYQTNVSKNSINMSGSGNIPVHRERDPQQVKLEQDVFAKMQNAIQSEILPDKPAENIPDIQPVDLKQALQELLDSAESLDNES